MNDYTAIAFRQSLSSLALQVGTLQLVANASPREWQLYLALSAILFFLKSQYLKTSEIRDFPLCTAIRFLLPIHLLEKSLVWFQEEKGLCYVYWSWLHPLLHSSRCLPYAWSTLLHHFKQELQQSARTRCAGNQLALSSVDYAIQKQLLAPVRGWSLAEILRRRVSYCVG